MDSTILAPAIGQAGPLLLDVVQYVVDKRGLGFTQDDIEAAACVEPVPELGTSHA